MPDPSPSPVHVIGASGRSGLALTRRLIEAGIEPVPVVRSAERWHATGVAHPPRIADLRDPAALRTALAGAKRIVSTAHARHAAAVLAAAPEQAHFVFLGSTRKFTRWPDSHGNGVLAGEDAFLRSGRSGVMLHPTMIYGAEGEDNVQRLAALLRRLPVVPLPGGGRALVQPIHQSDLTRAILLSLGTVWEGPTTLVACGPEAMPYRDFVREVTRAAGLRLRPVLPLPAPLLAALARPAGMLPGLPRIGPDEIRRLLEDKAFDAEPLRQRLGLTPMPLHDGLRLTFGTRPSGRL